MRSGKLARRLAPALFLCAGSAFAADPILPPMPIPPAAPVVESAPLLGTPVGIPMAPVVEPSPAASTLAPAGPEVVSPATPLPVEAVLSSEPIATPYVTGPTRVPGYAWVRAEYLSWNLTGSRVPALVTTAPLGIPIGVPGGPGTSILFGGDTQLGDHRSGGRLTFGTWLDCDRTIGWEVGGFWLDRQDDGIRAGSTDGSRIIASSPFVDANTGLLTAVLVSAPGVAAGTTQVSHAGRNVWGGEVLSRALLAGGDGWRLDGLAGMRYRGFSEQLDIKKTIFPLSPLVVPGTSIVCDDGIGTDNRFFGGVLGVDCQTDVCGWLVAVRPSIGIGRTESKVTRTGITIISVPGTAPQVFPGGTYNLDSNLGTVRTREWAVLPELDLRAVKELFPGVRVSLGYSCLYLGQVARAAEQIDPVVNPNLIPPVQPGGPARPAAILERSPAWLQGLSFGVEVRF